ncbi:MAG: EamA family transporter RarD [Myxococcales bacterium]|nr:EamA family transporter RarD [Myxococcales bacterium]
MKYETGSGLAGIGYALAAYTLWGVAPVYWKALGDLPAVELLGHRVVWSALLGILLVAATRGGRELRVLLSSRRRWVPMLATSFLIGSNWLTFLWAVLHDQVLATSLGYYITPLVNVVFGLLFLREKLSRWQGAAAALAAVGILQLTIAVGELPWVTVYLALSFGCYGLIRKVVPVNPVVGFAFETSLLAPFALVMLLTLAATRDLDFPKPDAMTNLLLIGSGAFTAAPLLCFNSAAKRLRLTTLGFFQYIAPSITFVMAVLLYDEPFTRPHVIAFGCVWVALLLYGFDSMRRAAPSAPSEIDRE